MVNGNGAITQAERLIASGDEFATVCGLVALGHHLGQGDDTHLRLCTPTRLTRGGVSGRARRPRLMRKCQDAKGQGHDGEANVSAWQDHQRDWPVMRTLGK
jgi:hypothetical protein